MLKLKLTVKSLERFKVSIEANRCQRSSHLQSTALLLYTRQAWIRGVRWLVQIQESPAETVRKLLAITLVLIPFR